MSHERRGEGEGVTSAGKNEKESRAQESRASVRRPRGEEVEREVEKLRERVAFYD
jgi:hypothetical protein